MIGCSGCKAKDKEIARLVVEKREVMDRLLATVGQFQATSEALNSAAGLDPTEITTPMTEAETIEAEEDEQRNLHDEAKRELDKFADARGVPPAAYGDV
jgi:hypothetical protein